MGLSGRHTVVRRKWNALDESRVGIVDVDVAEVFEAMEHGASHDGLIVLMRLYTMVINWLVGSELYRSNGYMCTERWQQRLNRGVIYMSIRQVSTD